MKKSVFVTGFATMLFLTATAQRTKQVPPPPPPAPVESTASIPPPPSEPPPPPLPSMPAQVPDDFGAFLKKNPSIKSVQWKNDELIIGLKSGEKERYNLSDDVSRKQAEAKYGELPSAPPPPPPPPAPPEAPKPPKKKSTLS